MVRICVLLLIALFLSIRLGNSKSPEGLVKRSISKSIEIPCMELEIRRTYYNDGTNGELYINNEFISYTIELPWKKNRKHISCIPEGRYELDMRYDKFYGWYLYVLHVPNREGILIHKGATNALTQLRGCITPSMILEGHGKGKESEIANEKLHSLICNNNTKIYLNIKCNDKK